MKITKEEMAQKILESGGKFFSARFVKKNNEIRDINCRLGVKKNLKGVGRKHPPGLINTFDIKANGYRYINAETLQRAKIGGVEYEC